MKDRKVKNRKLVAGRQQERQAEDLQLAVRNDTVTAIMGLQLIKLNTTTNECQGETARYAYETPHRV
jgi:hypothetical protein